MRTLLFLLTFIFFQTSAQDFKNSSWGDTPEDVLKNEKDLVFLGKESLDRNLTGLTFVEDGSEGIYYTHTYLFYNEKFYGVRTKRSYLDGDNTFYKALNDYNQKLESYKESYEKFIKEKAKQEGYEMKAFQIKLPERTLYVSLKKEEDDFFIMESTFSNNEGYH
ncbi:hypothetical protein RCC89_14965 [Cytophagaceae bacterium ABcell3]|nr:hypothetical protein RCC89_14965 [Cytophagaceae bacterium ABcell3]